MKIIKIKYHTQQYLKVNIIILLKFYIMVSE